MNLFKKKGIVKPKKIKVVKVGTHKIFTYLLWALFIFGFAFAVYKNFTAIDTHTIKETTVVEEKIVDTSGIESFVNNFVHHFYSWGDNKASLENRQNQLSKYLTDDLLRLNSGIISSDSGVTSRVANYNLWELTKLDDNNYKATYVVRQNTVKTVTETITEYVNETRKKEVIDEKTGKKSTIDEVVQKEVTKDVEDVINGSSEGCYSIVIHIDDNGDMVIVQNPTISNITGKSNYVPKAVTSDTSVNSETSKEIDIFFEKFFALYPTADENELAYYVKDNALDIINKDYTFDSITSKVYKEIDGEIKAYLTVKYYDNKAMINQFSQFILDVEKTDNWSIIGSEMYK